ncbi:MAG TPA: peptide chain release factor 2, partial [Candidatus Babeliales bacterium]|nr:peptide chain release factor 2 [Candidatus Babeliales bacterium]
NITISKRLSAIKQQREAYQNVISGYEETLELLDLFEADEAELKKMASDITQLCRNISKFKIELLLKNPEDKNACFMSINAGAGGTESQDWANMLLRMYTRFCERERLKTDIIDYQAGEEAGIKSATLYVTGKNAYGLLKTENGVHRLVRISPFDSNKRRHTSFSSVSVTPELQEVELAPIEQKDLRIDTYRASGAGGQHINKTESAVRITHIPTNIVVQCQNQRSQIQNRETAMKMLRAKLAHKQREKEEAKAQKGTAEKKKIEWGSQIRSYVLHPYKMVKDHRTSHESSQPDLVLDGDLIDFIEQYLVQ